LRHVRIEDGFTMVHASLDSPATWPYVFDRLAAASNFSYQRTALCFYGHTHLPMVFIRDGCVRGVSFTKFKVELGRQYFVNVGSVGEPRDGGLLAAYATYEPGSGEVELRRVSYDATITEGKLIEAGLPIRRKR
jgi:diadenosine tetraphosphatase ApaH/serine/threonine PP2A family protein phosphatase